MYWNLLEIIFGSLGLLALAGPWLPSGLPPFVKGLFTYEKFTPKGFRSWNLRVPKKWFQHFYVFASLISSFGLGLMISVYIFGITPSNEVMDFLDFWCSKYRPAVPKVSSTASLLAMFLLTIQSWKRLYETFFVSIFSNSKMDIGHYFLGYFHYFGSVLAILAEAPGFTRNPDGFEGLSLSHLTLQMIAASSIFLWASHQQLTCAETLANLRRNSKGDVVTLKHKIPKGGMFEWLSAPHLICEITMYAALMLILIGNMTWLFVFAWVISNQVCTSLLTHWWYQSEFKDYPKKRSALIPFIY